jgi:hypothetical protein
LTHIDLRPPTNKFSKESGIHESVLLVAVLGAATVALFKSITNAVTTPVTARRRCIGTVTRAEVWILLLSIITFAITARNVVFTWSQCARLVAFFHSWRHYAFTEWRGFAFWYRVATIRCGLSRCTLVVLGAWSGTFWNWRSTACSIWSRGNAIRRSTGRNIRCRGAGWCTGLTWSFWLRTTGKKK